jgi:hypothetical protein
MSATVVADDLINRIHRGAAGQIADHTARAIAEVVGFGGGGGRKTKDGGCGNNCEECFHERWNLFPHSLTGPFQGYSGSMKIFFA